MASKSQGTRNKSSQTRRKEEEEKDCKNIKEDNQEDAEGKEWVQALNSVEIRPDRKHQQ